MLPSVKRGGVYKRLAHAASTVVVLGGKASRWVLGQRVVANDGFALEVAKIRCDSEDKCQYCSPTRHR